jgi:hypothetical protein
MTSWAKPWNTPETVETAAPAPVVEAPVVEAPAVEEPKKSAKKTADTPAE